MNDDELRAAQQKIQEMRDQGWRIESTPEQIKMRYRDIDFAEQVPRELMYLDIGMLCGRVELLERTLIEHGIKLPLIKL